MKITKISTDDARELAEIDRLCFSVPWSEKSFLDEAQNPLARYFAARDGNKIVGYGGIWCVADEGQITNIAVLPEYRKNGIASDILEKLIEEANGMDIVLEVRESNRAAISLYKRYGFKASGVRKNFYHTPTENAIIMIRREH